MLKFKMLKTLLYIYYKFSLPHLTNKRGKASSDTKLLLNPLNKHFFKCLTLLKRSKSQLRQDLIVISSLNFKRKGYFVEFGATNGLDLSNTYLLERNFNWNGILAEPAKCWHEALKKNRSSHIEQNCVWSVSGEKITFTEAEIPEISTISNFNDSDSHAAQRKNGKTYNVETISLNELLDKYNAPSSIDFLSIDTEGSEFKILSHFDFDRYSFNVICVEHNHTEMREKIYELLTTKGYVRKYTEFSDFDDWYFNE